ncbi:MAG: exosortase family protein XrtF [Flavobacteriaceae bacterium]|nr:exosortase family protein XrtF [Flavobacteriaceae bacterium]
MSNLFQKYKGVIRFILIFLGVYILLSFSYHYYLSWSEGKDYYPDYVTYKVAHQSEKLICKMGFPVDVELHEELKGLKLLVHNRYTALIVEGCNAISVIILFIAFVISFYQGIKRTVLFVLVGGTLIYLFNVLRIAIITILYYRFPQYEKILHQIIFPALIYGMVFLLWMYWVKQFKNQKEVNE